jgi:hypothetical protein
MYIVFYDSSSPDDELSFYHPPGGFPNTLRVRITTGDSDHSWSWLRHYPKLARGLVPVVCTIIKNLRPYLAVCDIEATFLCHTKHEEPWELMEYYRWLLVRTREPPSFKPVLDALKFIEERGGVCRGTLFLDDELVESIGADVISEWAILVREMSDIGWYIDMYEDSFLPCTSNDMSERDAKCKVYVERIAPKLIERIERETCE